LRSAVDRVQAEDETRYGTAALQEMGQLGALRNLCDFGAPFEELLSDSPIFPLLDALLGNDYMLHSYDGLVLLPREGRFPWDFHTDLMPLRGVAFPAARTPGINCLYYLDDVTAANGATWIVPSSHRSVVVQPAAERLAACAIQAIGSAGDVLLFDARLWHCAGNNTATAPRRLIKALFVQPWLRPQMDYSRAVRAEVMERLSPRVRRLLGVGIAPPASIEELRHSLAAGKAVQG
jgi:ectoine hydroxylase-related dioxygenase (phytanoyl-CoA dioxygenase family)